MSGSLRGGWRLMGALALVLVHHSAADEPTSPARRVDPSVVREIERIQSGIGSVLANSSFAADENTKQPQPTPMDVADPQAQAEDLSPFGEAYERIANERPQAPTIWAQSEASPRLRARDAYAAALRNAARVLETAAADLEDSHSYDEADELRRRARDMRLDARKSGESPPAPAVAQ